MEVVESPITISITANPNAVEPTGAGSNNDSAITVTATENSQPKSGVSVSLSREAVEHSGGHNHNGSRPVGTFTSDSGSTGSEGTFQTTYTASKFGGQETITATAAGQTVSLTLNVRVSGLVQLTAGTGYELTGNTPTHPNNHYGTSTTNTALQGIARDFEVLYPEEPDLGYNDMSLEKGGLFDIGPTPSHPEWKLWYPPHDKHRKGKNCDLDNIDEGMGHLEDLKILIEGPPYNGNVHPEPNHWHLTF